MEHTQLLAASSRYRELYKHYRSIAMSRNYTENMLASPAIRPQQKRSLRGQLQRFNVVINGLLKEMREYEVNGRL